jgi:hypothetical protein
MTRPTYRTGELVSDGFSSEWGNNNSVGGSFVEKPGFIEIEDPNVGQSSRQLPSDKRTTPYIYVYDNEAISVEWNDVTWNSQDYTATVRLEVIVADDMNGKTGAQMRDDIIQVLENIREQESAPTNGVFGSDWTTMTLVNIDKTPTEFSNQWRAYYDIALGGLGVI